MVAEGQLCGVLTSINMVHMVGAISLECRVVLVASGGPRSRSHCAQVEPRVQSRVDYVQVGPSVTI